MPIVDIEIVTRPGEVLAPGRPAGDVHVLLFPPAKGRIAFDAGLAQ